MLRHLLLVAAVALLCGSASASTLWVQVRSPHFVVFTDADEMTGRHVAGQLERMRTFFQTVLPNAAADADQPITVLALQDEKSFSSVAPASSLQKGQGRLAGFFSALGDRNYIALQTDARFEHPYAVIYHEYTHFVLRNDYWLPLWLNEGMAQYFQNTDINTTEAAFGQPDFGQMSYLNQRMQLIPLSTLFKVDHNSPYYHQEDKMSVFYVESWALTHLLETADFQNHTHKISDYNQRVANGEDPAIAAQHVFGDLTVLEKQLSAYVARIGFQGIRLRSNVNLDESSFQASPISTDEANAVKADVLIHVGRFADAKALVEPILDRDPRNALAVRDMGFIAAAGEHDGKAARKWFDKAAELNPKDFTANFYSAVYDRNDPSAGASVESHLRRCIQLQPHNAAAYNNLADLFVTQHRNLDEAHMLSIQAVQLAPQVLIYRFTAAEVLEAQDNPESALMVLTEAKTRVARTPQQTAELDKRIARLQHSQTTASNSQSAASAAAH